MHIEEPYPYRGMLVPCVQVTAGKNVFLTGSGGVGKSFTSKRIVEYLQHKYERGGQYSVRVAAGWG